MTFNTGQEQIKGNRESPYGDSRFKNSKEMLMSFYNDYFQLGLDCAMPDARQPPALADVDLSLTKVDQLPIESISLGVLFGTLCGDSSIGISKGYKNARVQNRHSTRQSDWFFWKWLVGCPDFCKLESMTWQKPDGFQSLQKLNLGKLKVTTMACLTLTQVYHILCDDKKKRFKRYWLNHMNDYFLMTLWLDDGSVNGTQGVFCLDIFPVEDLHILKHYLERVWDVKTIVFPTGLITKKGQTCHRVKFLNQDEFLKFLRIIAPIVPVPSMLYKLFYKSNNASDSTQRWARELVLLVKPRFRAIVETYYAKELTFDS